MMEQRYKLCDLMDAVNETVEMLDNMGFPACQTLDFCVTIRPKHGKPVLIVEFPTMKV